MIEERRRLRESTKRARSALGLPTLPILPLPGERSNSQYSREPRESLPPVETPIRDGIASILLSRADRIRGDARLRELENENERLVSKLLELREKYEEKHESVLESGL